MVVEAGESGFFWAVWAQAAALVKGIEEGAADMIDVISVGGIGCEAAGELAEFSTAQLVKFFTGNKLVCRGGMMTEQGGG